MKLCDMSTFWPPVAGPHVGFKTIHKELANDLAPEIINAADLHQGAWWTGIRVLVQGGAPRDFTVELLTVDGQHFAGVESRWIQGVGHWTPLPWPIPTLMAEALGLQFRVTPLHNGPEPVPAHMWVKYDICFHEINEVSAYDRLLFVTGDNRPALHWNGQLRGGGDADAHLPLHRGVPHTVVFRMEYLINTNPAIGDRTATPIGWSEPVVHGPA